MLLISKGIDEFLEGSKELPENPPPMPTDEIKPITLQDILDIFDEVSQLVLKTEVTDKKVALVLSPSEKRELLKEGYVALTAEEFSYLMVDSEGNPYPPEVQRENFEKAVRLASLFPLSSLEVIPK